MYLPWEDQALSKLSYLVALIIGLPQSYQPVGYYMPKKYLVYGYGIMDFNHKVVSFLHKLCSASAYVKTGL